MSIRRILLTFTMIAVSAPIAFAEDELPGKKGRDEEVAVNLQGVTMQELIDIVQRETGKIFLYDKAVRDLKISIKVPRPIPRKALYSVFKSILETRHYGISEVDIGDTQVCKIAQSGRTFTGPTHTYSGQDIKADPDLLPKDDTMVTVVYPLQYAEARTAANQLRQIVNAQQGGKILGIPNVNVVIVTAFGSVMQRVFKIIDLMDVPGLQPVWKLVKIEHADPEIIASKVESILQARHQQVRTRQLQAQPPGKLVPEVRTRSIIVQALPEQFTEILSLIRQLDVKLDKEPSLVHVKRLKHTNAEDMEATINAIIQARPDIGTEEGKPDSGGAAPEGGAPSPRDPVRPRRPVSQRPSQYGTGQEEEQAAAIADKATNSLIIVGPEVYYRELEKIIDSLDVRRPQVLIEALIIQLSSARGLDLGAELAILDKAADGKVRGFGATAFGMSNIVDQNGNPLDFTSVSESGETLYPAGRLPSFTTQGITTGIMAGKNFKIPILLTLLGSESDVTVLSMPRILTNENEQAEIKVLEEVPTAQSQSTTSVGSAVGFSGFEDAGITLIVTPHVSEDESLRLEIEQTIEQFGRASPPVGGVVLPPSKTTREISNEVTVPNHRTVILGGLTSTVTTETTAKIPILGDIPLLGLLFRKTESRVEKKNLFVFITPHILDDPDFRDLERISDEALKEARELGVDTSKIDRHFRTLAKDDKRALRGKKGQTVDLMEYRPVKRDRD
ncbi:MAG: type II secretion system secretin GspD [Planctomycetota bacterium]